MSMLTIQRNSLSEMSQSMTFSMTRKGNVIVVCPSGPRVGEREASIISPAVREAIDELGHGLKGVVLDLSNVRVMSSFGLGLCIELSNHARLLGAETVLHGMCPYIRELFRVMKADRLFKIAITPRDVPVLAA